MQITLFKGLLPVNLPDNWFTHQAKVQEIKYACLDGRQGIDFRPVGGPVLVFWVSSGPDTGEVQQHHKRLQPEAVASLDWGTSRRHAFSVCSRDTVRLFGQSGKVLDLTHLA